MLDVKEVEVRNRKRSKGPVRVQLYATGLHNPSHMEWTLDGRLLVSEHTSGCVKDISKGGDMRNSSAFAYGLEGPASLKPLPDGRILVAETWGGRVKDISQGGDMSKQEAFATELSMPYSIGRRRLETAGEERVYVSESFGPHRAQITDITSEGNRESFQSYVRELPSVTGASGLTPLQSWPDQWENFAAAGCVKTWVTESPDLKEFFIAIGSLGQIMRVPNGGGDYPHLMMENHLIAWGLQKMGGMYYNAHHNLIYAVQPQCGNVVAIDPDASRNYQFEPPVVQGLHMPTCPRFSDDGETMFICDSAAGAIWRVENFN